MIKYVKQPSELFNKERQFLTQATKDEIKGIIPAWNGNPTGTSNETNSYFMQRIDSDARTVFKGLKNEDVLPEISKLLVGDNRAFIYLLLCAYFTFV